MIDAEGGQLGIMQKDEALKKAKEAELDLVEIAPNANPPVAKIIDFKKLRYEENKKERASNKSAGDLKELWLSPRIADHDLNVRLTRAKEFLKDGHKVKLTVKFKGREMAHTEFGSQLLQKAIGQLGEEVDIEREPKFEGRKLSVIITKIKGGKINGEDEDKQNNNEEGQDNSQG